MPLPVADISPGVAIACVVCSGAAFFQARAEWPRGHSRVGRRTSACAAHVVEAIVLLRAWGHDCGLADGWLTVLAIDPHALGRPRGDGEGAEPGFPFYSAPLSPDGLIRPR
jgi:hypothetical protein